MSAFLVFFFLAFLKDLFGDLFRYFSGVLEGKSKICKNMISDFIGESKACV